MVTRCILHLAIDMFLDEQFCTAICKSVSRVVSSNGCLPRGSNENALFTTKLECDTQTRQIKLSNWWVTVGAEIFKPLINHLVLIERISST